MGQVESVAEQGELDNMYADVGGDGYWALFQESFDLAVKSITRPPRSMYATHSLGPKSFELEGVTFQREDFSVRNRKGQSLVCSLWRRQTPLEDPIPCVVSGLWGGGVGGGGERGKKRERERENERERERERNMETVRGQEISLVCSLADITTRLLLPSRHPVPGLHARSQRIKD